MHSYISLGCFLGQIAILYSGVGSVPATPAMAEPLFCLQIDGYWCKPYVSYGYANGFINTGNSI